MQQILLKEFQQDLFYNNDTNVLLIENETSNISLIIKSNIYIDNGISTTVNISFKYKTSLENTYKIKSTSINFNYRPVPVTFYLNTDSSKLYIKNFKIEFLYNGKYYETDQDFFRDFNCFNIYTEDNANNYDIYIDTNIGIMDEDSYNSMQHPLMIEAIVDGYIHLMPHNDPIYIEPETPRIWYKINDGDYNELFRENNDNDEVEDILVGHGNLEDDNPFNDYHHYVIPIKQGETIYLFSPNLDRMVLVFFSTKKNEERWDEDIEVEVYNEQQIDDDIDDMTANELLAQIQALNTRIQTLESNISGKQNTISDLNTIRSGAALGATAIQQHQDLSNYATINYVDSSITSVYNYINSSQGDNPNDTSNPMSDNQINYDELYDGNYEYYKSQPLTFEILEDGIIKWIKFNSTSKTIKYKKNNGSWISITSTLDGASISVSNGDIIQFKGTNDTYYVITNDNNVYYEYYSYFSTTCKFNIYGNIMSLINENNFNNLNSLNTKSTFEGLFHDCSNLINATNLILPAINITEFCYCGLFSDCTSLITAPLILPATILKKGCYLDMFYGCTSLISVPILPATNLSIQLSEDITDNLGSGCYSGMFRECSSLIKAPELPATILSISCYENMFMGCINLIKMPELPATTLAYSCYSGMFDGCIRLNEVSILPAINLEPSCYNGMFCNCISLITAPELPATNLAESCYSFMFGNCTALTSAPELPATTLASNCYNQMFQGCTSLITAPTLPATTLVNRCYVGMFDGCVSLNYIKCMAELLDEGYNIYWVKDVPTSGTFIKNPVMTNRFGWSYIPIGWTIEDAA